MIVKNEERNLANCLQSIGDLASEIIVVDTGSTDKTVDIARAYRARVKHFTWIDDFAAARNESIKDAQGDWIFWLDADDRLTSDNLNRLKQAAASGLADAYVCQIICRVKGNDRSESTIQHLRLFRNGLGLKFEHPVHEQIAPLALRLGLIVARTNIAVEHIGYAVDDDVLKQKAERNLALIQKCLAQEPNSLYWRFHLGVNFYTLEAWAEVIDNLEAVVNQPTSQLAVDNQLYEAHSLLIAAYRNAGQVKQARYAVSRALEIYPESRHLWILTGKFYLTQDEIPQAIQALEHAQTLPSDFDPSSMIWPAGTLERLLTRAYLRQGQIWHNQGQYQHMAAGLSKVIDVAPADQKANVLKLLAVALQNLGCEDEAVWCWQMANGSTPL